MSIAALATNAVNYPIDWVSATALGALLIVAIVVCVILDGNKK